MALNKYMLDLRNISPDERQRILETVDQYSFTGTEDSGLPLVYIFYLDQGESVSKIPGLPLALIRQIP